MINLTDTTFLYALVFITLSLGLLLIGIVILYIALLNKYTKLGEQKRKDDEEFMRKANKTLQDASVTASEIIRQTTVKAGQILANAQNVGGQIGMSFEEALKIATTHQLQKYEETLKKLSDQSDNMLQKISEDIKNSVLAEIKQFSDQLGKEVKNIGEQAKSIEDNLVGETNAEIEAYKIKKLAQLDKAINEIIETVVKKVIGKTISSKDHSQIIIKALEEAKRDKLF